MNLEALKELAAMVEAGRMQKYSAFRQGHDHWSAIAPRCHNASRAYHGSLDAAKDLHDDMLSGWRWEGGAGGIFAAWKDPQVAYKARNEIPARAWLLAILKALIAQEESK
jgi:hypothetical protein